ncbi:flagellar basal body P-ring protein FlgI [Zavarzinella formosa]|uniref:flagellar basal body P-ring protein FlgI n=1 Tax=Zavarzinella formosa TaxID=360055 RepID=UPI00030C1208|nr:flagellar basal body P-ring protein FlgI [Zavarzinella formosa]
MRRFLMILAGVLLLGQMAAAQVRIKDISELEGARSNLLHGFGLVVGLDGTGSRSTFTQQVAVDMLQKNNVTATIFSQLPSDNVIRSTSISAVMVTAEIGPFARKGSRLDVTISALDDARSLQGGTLIMTPLRGADNEIYVVAQGPLSVGGFSVSGQTAGVQKNHLNVGRIANGGMVEKEALGEVLCKGRARFLLKDADFNTARMVAKVINEKYPGYALAQDAGTVAVGVPKEKASNPVAFLSELGLMEVNPDRPARIVINERTGTVVAGENVTINPTAIAHGNLYLLASETPQVSQPNPLTGGATTVVPRTSIAAVEQRARLNVVPRATTVAEVARALNSLGVTPRDLISIFQALKQAGALNAEIVVI